MDESNYEYRITSGKTPVVLSFLLAAAFGGCAFWLHRTGNAAFPVLALFSAFTCFVFLLALYRFFFFRVCIGADGFYYQTQIGNGKHYRYADVAQAWESSGPAQSGMVQSYCNVSFSDGRVIRFLFYPADAEAVGCLLARAAAAKTLRRDAPAPEEYRIDGKFLGKARIAVGLLILVVLIGMDVLVARSAGVWFLLIPGGVMALAVCLYLVVSYRCFLVKIGADGFFCRTTPWNGRFYPYREIASCREIRRVVYRHGFSRGASGSNETNYYFLFEFTCADGRKRRFLFEKAVYSHEIAVLRERIEQAKQGAGPV